MEIDYEYGIDQSYLLRKHSLLLGSMLTYRPSGPNKAGHFGPNQHSTIESLYSWTNIKMVSCQMRQAMESAMKRSICF